ncbi:7TM diverse intracellular signaling domain-containing protein [Nitrosophilus kaiyonis]|uniref:7TM diverse intracellular signaling domain-containing protein n=1 Tax=Nitrosophilus kaiyonis TaxID=2930200 RepID=UPI002493688C|nr:7TM diverse intracellular signaling domain-containing protein [Nitrosophilus kaiyonis]
MLKRYLILLIPIYIFANTILIDANKKFENITPYINYFLDEKSQYDINYILTHKNLFHKSNKNKLLFGYKYNSSLWIWIKLKNPTNKKIVKILEYDYPIQEKIIIYDIKNNSIYFNGYFSKKFPPKYITHPIKLTFFPYETKEFIIKAKDENVGLIAKLNLWNIDEFEKNNENKKLINILFLGGMLALILYNIFLLFLTKDITYFYYIIMVTTFLILELFVSGFFPLYIQNFYLTKIDLYVLLLIMAFSMIFFASYFLELEKKFSKINNFLIYVTLFIFILFALNITDLVSTYIQRFFYLFLFVLLIAIGIYTFVKGNKQAKYYIFGWILLLVSAILLGLNQAGIIDWIDNFPYIGKISIFTEALLFSMALSARINTFRDEKEKAIEMLLNIKDQEKLKLEEYAEKKTKELRYALDEKDVLIKELHHRVKNNLQIIISLLRLQSDKIENKKLSQILLESENRIRALSSVHEMLYKSDNIAEIDAREYLENLVKEISLSFSYKENIKVTVISNAKLSMDKAIYCGLIINELITNAFKHAFDDNHGEIEVALIERPKDYELTIRDNGKGIGNSLNFGNSLGIKLVNTLIKKQLKGTIEVISEDGTFYIINFDKK